MVPLCPSHSRANLQNVDGKSKVGSSFSNSQWLSCSLVAPIDHSSPDNLPTLHLIYQLLRDITGKWAEGSDRSDSIVELWAQYSDKADIRLPNELAFGYTLHQEMKIP
jgi:hypothetical protein